MMLSPDAKPDTSPFLRIPPHNLQAEQALLGAILLDNGAFDRVSDIITADHFFDPLHANIYETLSTVISSGRLATPMTLKPYYDNAEPISDKTTVPQYLGSLVRVAGTRHAAREYGLTILELAQRRGLIVIGEGIVESAFDATADKAASGIIEDAEQELFRIAESGSRESRGEVTFAAAARKAAQAAQEACRRRGAVGLSTGLRDLDAKLGGLCRTDLIILAGRPSMGKTALAVNIAWSIARNGNPDENGEVRPAPVGFFSLEMGDSQLATRVLSSVAEVSSEKIRYGTATNDELERIVRASQDVADTPLFIDDRGGITIAQLMSRARKMRRQYGIELLVVDYLQLMAGKGRRGENRVQEVTEITTGLKAIAKELNIPVLALSQLSRNVETRDEKKPQLSDLRESGSIEQDADVVLFVFREEYYLERTKPSDVTSPEFSEWQRKMGAASGKAEVIIGKQRHGPVGTVELAFEGGKTRFSDLAREMVPG